ncbi:TetR/AcrR family transcriptional regulator [Hamadaea sp. NPDC050747]|uniref:TetR/AcrR family transcriptional regulator n=1 Tax=Hamadaea sp. NPDC050747 TaxID=3155789 RepID=UPI0033E80922
MADRAREPAGAAVRRPEITAAVLDAVVRELSEVGFGRLSVEGVARRAGVAKSAVYRRWNSKLEMVLELLSGMVSRRISLPDKGSLQADLTMVVDILSTVLEHPMAKNVLPDLLAEAARNPQIETTLHAAIQAAQRDVGDLLVSRAVDRGELPGTVDRELLTDLIAGPLYWRISVMRSHVPPGYADQLSEAIRCAVQAASRTGLAPH